MPKVLTNRSKLYAAKKFNANFDTGDTQQFDVSEHIVIKLVVQDAGPTNALVVHARIRGRDTWSSIYTVMGDTEEIQLVIEGSDDDDALLRSIFAMFVCKTHVSNSTGSTLHSTILSFCNPAIMNAKAASREAKDDQVVGLPECDNTNKN